MKQMDKIKAFLDKELEIAKKENYISVEDKIADIIDFIEKTENEERNKEISAIAEDLQNLIDYDEWAAREYGETKVDIYITAMNLYNAGYRKVISTDAN